MRICFENAETLNAGIAVIKSDLDLEVVSENADLTVTVAETGEPLLSVTLLSDRATVTYGGGKARFFRGLATVVGWYKDGKREMSITERPLFCTNGAMVDVSRNAVMRVETVKEMLRRMALMGLNTFMLYTEDTYEIEGRPYFGHARGRYTPAELRELDAYAIALGIELVPCIQVLGHLATHLCWPAAVSYKDTAQALLVGAEETYALIEDMLCTIESCFTSRRLHVGMDETHDLGTGRYLDQNGYRERRDIYFEHLKRVIELSRAHGFSPMMWSDMFFRLAGKELAGYRDYDMRVEFTDEVMATVPRGIQQVFWDYYNEKEEFYAINIEKHQQVFGEAPLFAGGVWLWSGHCPLYSRSLSFSVPALDACRKAGVSEVLATVWHNGAESSLIMGLAGLAWYADYDYKGGFDETSMKRCFRYACGVDYDTLMLCELPEHPDGSKLAMTRALLYNDPFLGLVDKHLETFDLRAYYTDVTARLAADKCEKGIFAPAYDTVYRLSDLLVEKADFGLRLKAAYDKGDREALTAMVAECDRITEKLNALRRSHRASWMAYNKPFGWEVFDIRYGGLLMRFDTVKERLAAYLAGSLTRIEELEIDRLRLDGRPVEDPPIHNRFLWNSYRTYATAGVL